MSVKGVGMGRDAAIRAPPPRRPVESIKDVTGVPHGGVRPRKLGGSQSMARDTHSIVKMSRREGCALHPQGLKALVKRIAKPGQAQN